MIRFTIIEDRVGILALGPDRDAEECMEVADQIRARLPDWRVLVLGDDVEVTDLRGNRALADQLAVPA